MRARPLALLLLLGIAPVLVYRAIGDRIRALLGC